MATRKNRRAALSHTQTHIHSVADATSNESENIKIFEAIKKLVGRISGTVHFVAFSIACFRCLVRSQHVTTQLLVFPYFRPLRCFTLSLPLCLSLSLLSISSTMVRLLLNKTGVEKNFLNANKSFASMRQGHRWPTRANKNEFFRTERKRRKLKRIQIRRI